MGYSLRACHGFLYPVFLCGLDYRREQGSWALHVRLEQAEDLFWVFCHTFMPTMTNQQGLICTFLLLPLNLLSDLAQRPSTFHEMKRGKVLKLIGKEEHPGPLPKAPNCEPFVHEIVKHFIHFLYDTTMSYLI